MNLICLQLDLAWEDKPANYQKVRSLLDGLEVSPDSLIVLPEMFATGFSMNLPAVLEKPSGPTEEFLACLARDYRAFIVAGATTFGQGGRGKNEALVFSPEGTPLGRYCKWHPFSPAGETDHYEPGTELVTFSWAGFTVAPFICYDLRFPEIFRAAIRQGAELFVVIANWPAKREGHWVTLLQARAIENQAYVAGVNRCGRDPRFSYPGRTMVVDPHGHIIADAGPDEAILTANIDREALLAWRRDFPALKDMRSGKE
jgi:omega-amidase